MTVSWISSMLKTLGPLAWTRETVLYFFFIYCMSLVKIKSDKSTSVHSPMHWRGNKFYCLFCCLPMLLLKLSAIYWNDWKFYSYVNKGRVLHNKLSPFYYWWIIIATLLTHDLNSALFIGFKVLLSILLPLQEIVTVISPHLYRMATKRTSYQHRLKYSPQPASTR